VKIYDNISADSRVLADISLFTGRKQLKHKKLIRERIESWKQRIKDQEIEIKEILLSLFD